LSPATATVLFDAVQATGDDVAGLVAAVKGSGPREARQAADYWVRTHTPETPEERERKIVERRSFTQTGPREGLITTTIVQPVLDARLLAWVVNDIVGAPGEHDPRTREQRLTDGITELCHAYASGSVTGGRERPHLLLLVDATTGEAETTSGDHVPAHVVARVAEDAVIQRVLTTGSAVLDLGRRVRTASDDQYRALVARDGGCRYPGCTIPAEWCDVDHLQPWSHHGPSNLDNLVLWCHAYHHRFKHRPDVTVLGDANHLTLRLPDGTILACPPKQRRTPAAA
jgi:hypothetical protein